MSTPSKNFVEDDDDDQDYIPVGILQLSSIRQPIHLETHTTVASDVSYNQKQHKDTPFQQTPPNLPQLEQHEAGNFENGQGRRRSNLHQSPVAEDDFRNLTREEVKQDPFQHYKIFLQYMQQQKAQAQANNDQLSPNSQGKVRSSTLLPNASPSGSYENQRQSQDLNSNVPVESKNQLLKILTLGRKDVVPSSVPGSVFVSRSEARQNPRNVTDDSNNSLNSNTEIQSTILHGHIEQNTPKQREDQAPEYESHRSSNSVLRIDISNSHIPKSSVEQILQQSPISIAASSFNSHPHVNHQHPEISKRLNSPVSPGRQSTSPRQAISPRQAGSPRQISSSPCQFVSPKQPVSPRGTVMGPWKSQPSSPQSFQPPSPRSQSVSFPWQLSSPSSSQTIPTRKSYDSSTALKLPSPIPQLPVSFSSSTNVTHNKVTAEGIHHQRPSRFQPIRCSPSQVSYSGGIVHHRPLLDALHNPSNILAQFDPSPSKVALISTQASVPQHTSLLPQRSDSSVSTVWMSKQNTNSDNEVSTPSQQCHNREMVDQPTALTSLPSSQDSFIHKGNNFVKPRFDDIDSELLRDSSSIDHGEDGPRQCDNGVSHGNKVQQGIGDDGINGQLTKSFQDHDDDKESLANVEASSKTVVQKTENCQTGKSESKKLLHPGKEDVEKSGEIQQENVNKQEGEEMSLVLDEKSLTKSEGKSVDLNEGRSRSNSRVGTGKLISPADGQDSEGSSSVSEDTQKDKEKESGRMISGREASSKRQRKPKVPFENSNVSPGKVKRTEKVDDGSQQRKNEWKMSKQEKPQVRKGSSLRMQSILTRSGLRLKGSQMNTKPMSTDKNGRNNRGQFIKKSMARSDLKSTKRLVAKKGNVVKEPEKNQKIDESGKEPERNKRKRTENGQEYEKNKLKGIESGKEHEKEKKKVEKSNEPEKNKKKGTENSRESDKKKGTESGKEPEKDKKKGTESGKELEKDKKKGTEGGKELENDKKKGTESGKELEKDKKKGTEGGKEPEKDKKKGTESSKEPEKDKKKGTESGKEPEKDKKKGTESGKEPEKDKKKGTESGKELEKDKKKGTESSKEPEKDKKKGTEISKGTEKGHRSHSSDHDSSSSKETDMNVRSSSRLLARQSVATVDKNKNTPPSKLKNQSQESPNLEPEKRVATRNLKARGETSDIPEKLSTLGMTTRQSDGTRKTSNKRAIEFLESLPFSSRKRTKSEEVISKESLSSDKNNAEPSEVRSTRSKSKPGSVKDSLETDEDEEYKIEDDEDDEEDSSGERITRTTRSRRFRFPTERKISMNLRGEARKRKYNLVDKSSSDESDDDEDDEDDDDDDDDDKDSDHTDEEEMDESDRGGLPGKNIENLIAMARKEKAEENFLTQDAPVKTEPTLVTADLSKLAAFKLVPLSPEELTDISGSELVLPSNGFVLPGTNNIFLPPHCIQHLKTETNPNMSSSGYAHSKAIPCSRVLVTPRPISSVTDSSTKTSAFSSPSTRSSCKEQVSSLSSSSKILSSVPSSKPWNSPSLPTPPPSVSSSSSHSSSSSWNPVANLPWVPENSSTWNSDPAGNESWRNNGYMSRGSYGNNLAINTDDMPLMPNSAPLTADHDSDPARNDRILQGLFREASNLSPSSYNIALPGLGQQDISYLESKLQQDMDISSSMLLSEVPYEEGIHESVSVPVHHDAGHLVCSVNLDDADGLGSATPTLHLPGSSLENINVPQPPLPPPPPPPPPHQQQQVGVLALNEDGNILMKEKMVLEDVGGKILQKNGSTADVQAVSMKSTDKSLMNSRRHLYDVCIVDDKKMGKCLACGNMYSLTSIYRHLRKHDNPNYSFSCNVCGKKYSQKHHLLVHMKKLHGFSPNGEPQLDGDRTEEKSSEAEATKLKHGTSSESQPTRKSTPHSARETDNQIESNTTNSGAKESKKKSRKRSVERKFSKDGLLYEQMPESPNAISLDSKREARWQVERFRRMKARNKFAARNDMSGITMDISQLDSDTTDEENVKEKGSNIKGSGEGENIKVKQKEQFGNEGNDMDLNEYSDIMHSAESEKTAEDSLGTDLGVVGDGTEEPVEGGDSGVDDKQDDSPKIKHPCTLCHSVLASRCSFLMHMRRHNNAKDKVCTYCGKGFITCQELRSHERTHTGERPFACEICKLTFAHSGSYQAHKKGHFRKGETVPFPPDKCYSDGKLPLRGKKRAVSDGAEKQDVESESEPISSDKKDHLQSVSATETNMMRNDTSSIEFRRRSADSGPLQLNLKNSVSEMGPPWPIPSSDNFSWKNRSNTEHDKRQIVALESNVPQDHRGQVQHRPAAVNFRDQASPPFYSPTHYMSTGENPMMSPNSRRTPTSPSQKFSTCFPSPAPVPLNTHVKSPSQDQSFSGNQGYSSRDESRPFVSPVTMTSRPHPQMHASPSPKNVTPSNYIQSPQQYNMLHPSNSSPNYSQQVQKHHTPHLSMQEQSGGEMVKNYMSPYHSLSSPSYPGSSQMDYSVNQQGLAVDRSPLHTPSQPSQPPTMHPNQQMPQRHQQQHPQRGQQVPLYHQPGIPHQQFQQHHHPSDLQHQPTHKQQQPPQQSTPSRQLQQLLTQQPPPPYTPNKPTPPPPYPSGISYNEFYHSPQQQQQRDKSQTPRNQEDSFQSQKIPPQQHNFNTAFTSSSHFQTGSSSQPSAISVIRSIQSAATDNSPTQANFGQPIRVPPGQMNASAYSSSSPSTPQPYQHHPSPSSTPSQGYFHQGSS